VLSDTAKFVPGTYDLIVQAPGYGIQRFTQTFTANQTATVVFSMQTNLGVVDEGSDRHLIFEHQCKQLH